MLLQLACQLRILLDHPLVDRNGGCPLQLYEDCAAALLSPVRAVHAGKYFGASLRRDDDG